MSHVRILITDSNGVVLSGYRATANNSTRGFSLVNTDDGPVPIEFAEFEHDIKAYAQQVKDAGASDDVLKLASNERAVPLPFCASHASAVDRGHRAKLTGEEFDRAEKVNEEWYAIYKPCEV